MAAPSSTRGRDMLKGVDDFYIIVIPEEIHPGDEKRVKGILENFLRFLETSEYTSPEEREVLGEVKRFVRDSEEQLPLLREMFLWMKREAEELMDCIHPWPLFILRADEGIPSLPEDREEVIRGLQRLAELIDERIEQREDRRAKKRA